jgi:hypothetical protein
MKCAVLALLSVLCVGCALTQEQAVAIATGEINRRNLPLPSKYVTVATPSRYLEAGIDYWDIIFVTEYPQKRLYEVLVNQHNHRVEDVTNFAHHVPTTQ